MRTQIIETAAGTFEVSVPNEAMPGDGFYISYNDVDQGIYGSDTTAIVVGQMQRFFILNGDHREGYAPLIQQGFDACIAYYEAHISESNKFSDKLPLDIEIAPSSPRP
jgi:hypothetical protein